MNQTGVSCRLAECLLTHDIHSYCILVLNTLYKVAHFNQVRGNPVQLYFTHAMCILLLVFSRLLLSRDDVLSDFSSISHVLEH